MFFSVYVYICIYVEFVRVARIDVPENTRRELGIVSFSCCVAGRGILLCGRCGSRFIPALRTDLRLALLSTIPAETTEWQLTVDSWDRVTK